MHGEHTYHKYVPWYKFTSTHKLIILFKVNVNTLNDLERMTWALFSNYRRNDMQSLQTQVIRPPSWFLIVDFDHCNQPVSRPSDVESWLIITYGHASSPCLRFIDWWVVMSDSWYYCLIARCLFVEYDEDDKLSFGYFIKHQSRSIWVKRYDIVESNVELVSISESVKSTGI